MGIVISYKGTLDEPSRRAEALEEVRAFCRRVGWRFEDLEEKYSGVVLLTQEQADGEEDSSCPPDEPWPEEPEGQMSGMRVRVLKSRPPKLIDETMPLVAAFPPGCEGLVFRFNSSGRLCYPMKAPAGLILNPIPDTNHYLSFPNFLKTGSVQSHVGICLLLDLMRTKYISNLEVEDSTGFYESRNLEELQNEHAMMGALIGAFRDLGTVNKILEAAGLPKAVAVLDPKEALATTRPEPKSKKARAVS